MKRYTYTLTRDPEKRIASLCLAYGLLGTVSDREFGEHKEYSLICSGVSLIESNLILTFDEFEDRTYKVTDRDGNLIRSFAWHEIYRGENYNRYFRPELMMEFPQ
jgi:hypothetical protein